MICFHWLSVKSRNKTPRIKSVWLLSAWIWTTQSNNWIFALQTGNMGFKRLKAPAHCYISTVLQVNMKKDQCNIITSSICTDPMFRKITWHFYKLKRNKILNVWTDLKGNMFLWLQLNSSSTVFSASFLVIFKQLVCKQHVAAVKLWDFGPKSEFWLVLSITLFFFVTEAIKGTNKQGKTSFLGLLKSKKHPKQTQISDRAALC